MAEIRNAGEAAMSRENIHWRDDLKSIAEMNKYMLDHQIRVDCTFRVGDDPDNTQVFHCHKFVLARSSSVFDAMFYGSLPEEKEVRVTDVEPKIFTLLLKYIYTYELHLDDVNDAVDLLMAATKYMLKSLTSKCLAYMCRNVDATNVLRCLDLLALLDNQEDKSSCLKVLQNHTRLLINSEEFENISESTLTLLLDQDMLSCREYELVKAAVIWAKKQTELQDKSSENDDQIRSCLLKNILPRLRFLTMSQVEFQLVVGERNWLTDEEKKFILNNINNKCDSTDKKGILCDNKLKRKKYNNESTDNKVINSTNNY